MKDFLIKKEKTNIRIKEDYKIIIVSFTEYMLPSFLVISEYDWIRNIIPSIYTL